MSNEQFIADASDLRKYRTEIPNMADDEMDAYEYRLYGHYKRVCGAAGGTCFESVRTTAEKTRISVGKVVSTREQLKDKGWIVTGEHDTGTVAVVIVDRWPENFARYAERSPHEQQRSSSEQGRSPGEPKNKPVKKKQREEGGSPAGTDYSRYLRGQYAEPTQP